MSFWLNILDLPTVLKFKVVVNLFSLSLATVIKKALSVSLYPGMKPIILHNQLEKLQTHINNYIWPKCTHTQFVIYGSMVSNFKLETMVL